MLSLWGKMDSDMFQSCDELLHALVHYTQHSRRVRDGFEFFFQFFCARNGHCIDGRPTTRLFACFRAGEGWRVRIPVPCIHEYASDHEYASARTSNDVTSQLTVELEVASALHRRSINRGRTDGNTVLCVNKMGSAKRCQSNWQWSPHIFSVCFW